MGDWADLRVIPGDRAAGTSESANNRCLIQDLHGAAQAEEVGAVAGAVGPQGPVPLDARAVSHHEVGRHNVDTSTQSVDDIICDSGIVNLNRIRVYVYSATKSGRVIVFEGNTG